MGAFKIHMFSFSFKLPIGNETDIPDLISFLSIESIIYEHNFIISLSMY